MRGGEEARRDLARIFSAAVGAVDPAALVRAHVSRRGARWVVGDRGRDLVTLRGSALVVGAGKAAARMAVGCEGVLGPDKVRGLVVVPDGCEVPLQAVRVARAAHPLPDTRGAEATEAVCRLLGSAGSDPILCLISGGASSLLVRPRAPVTLRDKMETNRLLLASGVDVGAINTVRKHLSDVKGGGLLRLAGSRPVVTLILSDVIGDDPSVIGSGPTVPDLTSYADAQAVIKRAGIESGVPGAVVRLIEQGVQGGVAETVKPYDPEAQGSIPLVIGSNRTALAAAADEAMRLGYTPIVAAAPLAGETRECALEWSRALESELASRPSERCCIIAGGETTVTVKGTGRGGRNQEFALAQVAVLAGSTIAVLSAGSDGIDGPTDAAGAFVDGQTLERARLRGLNPGAALRNNDSYAFFDALGDLFRCGPTGTNVMDIKLAVRSAR